VISPDDLNDALPPVIVAPLTSKGQPLGSRPVVRFKGRSARILLDQLRAVDKRRLAGRMGSIDPKLWHAVLLEMFVYPYLGRSPASVMRCMTRRKPW